MTKHKTTHPSHRYEGCARKTHRTVKALGAFYHNDSPDGFGVVLNSPGVELMAEFAEKAYQGFKALTIDEQRAMLDGLIYEQLKSAKHIADRLVKGDVLSPQEHAHLFVYGVTNIMILEREGLLKPDEHNGMLYIHEVAS